ncbi:hypothetical protein PR048_016903 [Dryococelus australis]|uniref:Uncharacterized protein n=1 Tax=Dryococelus australis TaxID=614101 RepID=A0ABQ9H805_9NEOP|nr:hypothetical protein PR048_016903 [Dryococelus australis]
MESVARDPPWQAAACQFQFYRPVKASDPNQKVSPVGRLSKLCVSLFYRLVKASNLNQGNTAAGWLRHAAACQFWFYWPVKASDPNGGVAAASHLKQAAACKFQFYQLVKASDPNQRVAAAIRLRQAILIREYQQPAGYGKQWHVNSRYNGQLRQAFQFRVLRQVNASYPNPGVVAASLLRQAAECKFQFYGSVKTSDPIQGVAAARLLRRASAFKFAVEPASIAQGYSGRPAVEVARARAPAHLQQTLSSPVALGIASKSFSLVKLQCPLEKVTFRQTGRIAVFEYLPTYLKLNEDIRDCLPCKEYFLGCSSVPDTPHHTPRCARPRARLLHTSCTYIRRPHDARPPHARFLLASCTCRICTPRASVPLTSTTRDEEANPEHKCMQCEITSVTTASKPKCLCFRRQCPWKRFGRTMQQAYCLQMHNLKRDDGNIPYGDIRKVLEEANYPVYINDELHIPHRNEHFVLSPMNAVQAAGRDV